jgi:hypothetical protein
MSNCAEKTFYIGFKPIKIINKQAESNGKHKCLGQCDNCIKCSNNDNQKN